MAERRTRLGFNILELLRETWTDLRQNRLRSVLTMLGIAWGVASLIFLTAVGEGMRKGQQDKNRLLGKNIMIMWSGSTSMPGPGLAAGRPTFLTYDDYKAVREQAYWVREASPELARDLTCSSPINQGSFEISGILPGYQDIRTLETSRGRLLSEQDVADSARVCVIGDDVDNQLFKRRCAPGDEMGVKGLKFRVVGVLARKDQNSNYSGPDNFKVFVPYTAMRRDFPFRQSPMGDRELSQIIAQPVSIDMCEAAEYQVRTVLARRKGFDPLDKDALPVWNTGANARMMDGMFSGMKVFMGFVAVVTLVLGGIGVMNIMLVSVRSRTREIGLRKALGATRRGVMALFFMESLLISMGSGLIGYLGAMGLCSLLNRLPIPDFFAGFIVDAWTGWIAFGFLVFVSLAAAYYPAHSAAALDPAEALRYEES